MDGLVQYEVCVAISPLLALACNCRYGVPKAAVDVEILEVFALPRAVTNDGVL